MYCLFQIEKKIHLNHKLNKKKIKFIIKLHKMRDKKNIVNISAFLLCGSTKTSFSKMYVENSKAHKSQILVVL